MENVRPSGLWLKNFLSRASQNVHILKRIVGKLHGISQVCTQSVGSIKPIIVLTDNRSVTCFFQTKTIPPALWNACDYALHYNFKKAVIAGSVNTAAGFLSRLELQVTEKTRLKIREDIQTTPIEVITSSSDVADEERYFFMQADKADESEEQTLQRKEQCRQNAK